MQVDAPVDHSATRELRSAKPLANTAVTVHKIRRGRFASGELL
jgi:hypothetical protein